jgi:putative tryptophan/tyrosine transport system substrate-binding protein
MRRREFIAGAGLATAWPLAGRAQQIGQVRRVGILMNSSPANAQWVSYLTALTDTLKDRGWRNGQNVRIEVRWTGGDPKLIRSYAGELVGIGPDVLVSSSTANLDALRQVTLTIPIVFVQVSDPVAQGYVQNLSHPDGNITGFAAFEFSMGAKWLDLLKQIAPMVQHVAGVFNPDTSPQSVMFMRAIETAAPPFGVKASAVRTDAELDAAVARVASQGNGGLIFTTDSFIQSRGARIVPLINQHRLPSIWAYSGIVRSGGLMSYTPDFVEQFKQAGHYTDRILNGAKPGDLPVQLPTKYRLTINLNTAKTLGLVVPEKLLFTADEVIE